MPVTFEVEAVATINGKVLPCRVLGVAKECYGVPETYLVELSEGSRRLVQAKALEFSTDNLQ
jgi:hypothetical protein